MPRLIHLNGPPAVGKSAVADALTRRRPLALNLDIDELRVRLGGWQDHDESKGVARGLAFQLAAWHLASGRDVVLPQLLVRIEVVQELAALAEHAGAWFHEVVLTAHAETCVQRMRQESSREHPRDAFDDVDLAARIAYSCEAMRQLERALPGAVAVDAQGEIGQTVERVEAAIRAQTTARLSVIERVTGS